MKQINLKVEDEVKEKFEKIAEENQRSLKNQFIVMVEDYYQQVSE